MTSQPLSSGHAIKTTGGFWLGVKALLKKILHFFIVCVRTLGPRGARGGQRTTFGSQVSFKHVSLQACLHGAILSYLVSPRVFLFKTKHNNLPSSPIIFTTNLLVTFMSL